MITTERAEKAEKRIKDTECTEKELTGFFLTTNSTNRTNYTNIYFQPQIYPAPIFEIK